ncbi:GNAT family N-acetyltransferase [Aspergillus foveolatus]|uniref:GNAT family N-acetyltransferase n=1 Tax=Aspergillus foveolatus TaxID=210207 RepID=UPI003CCE1117
MTKNPGFMRTKLLLVIAITSTFRRGAEEAEEHRNRMELQVRREARREPLRSPRSPVADIYLRPVDVNKDTPELREIYNWYTQNSFTSPNIHIINEDEVRQRIEESRSTNLPCIVAIDRRVEKILGYALAREFDRHAASHFTAELDLYVKDEHTNLGIGQCLLDKLLEICDPSYTPKCGCSFKTSKEERSGYYPGGTRRLARLIFTLCYVDMKAKDISKHERVKKWLKQRGEFEEEGLLRGIRVKNNHLINVAYLVRTIGHSHLNKLDF